MFKVFVADFVYFWALFGAIIRNIIRNINVQKRGGSKAVLTMLKKTDDLVLENVPYHYHQAGLTTRQGNS